MVGDSSHGLGWVGLSFAQGSSFRLKAQAGNIHEAGKKKKDSSD